MLHFRTHRRLCVFRFLCVVLAAPAQLLDLRRAAIDLVFDFPARFVSDDRIFPLLGAKIPAVTVNGIFLACQQRCGL